MSKGTMTLRKDVKMALSIIAGAAVGYAYYYFIGCNSGTCPITSSPYISTGYGAVLGLVIAFPTKRKSKSNVETE